MKVVKQAKLIHALRSTAFVRLWIGQTVSSLGDGAFTVALAWEVLLLTGSGTALGVVMTAEIIPMVLFLLIGGVIADRFPRRFVMLCSDITRMVVMLVITALSWLHVLQLWHLIALALLFGIAQSFFYPAYQAWIPQLVKTDSLQSANALTQLSKQISGVCGPMVGAGCITLAGPTGAFALDGFTFAVSVYSLLLIQVPVPSKTASQENLAADNTDARSDNQFQAVPRGRLRLRKIVLLRAGSYHKSFERPFTKPGLGSFLRESISDVQDGLKYVASSTWLWVSIAVAAIVNIGLEGPLGVALPKLVYNVYHTGVWLLGMLYTARAVGSIITPIFFGQLYRIPHRGKFAYLALMGSVLSLIVLGLPLKGFAASSLSLVAIACIGFGLGFFGLIWVTLLQELVPEEKLGRVNSIDWLCSFGLTPVGFAVAGVLADHIGPSWTFVFGGILGFVMVGIAFSVDDIRHLE
jgi:MFS family permease